MHVVIVGAGPCGFSLGLVLARAGIQVTLFEKAETVGVQPRAAHIFAPGIQVLRRAGVLRDVRRVGFIPNGTTFRKVDGTPLVTLEEPIESPDATAVVPIDTLGKIMLNHAMKYDNMTVKWNHAVFDVGQDEKSAWVMVKHDGGPEQKIYADYVCGCDGGQSQVRKSLFGAKNFPGKTWDFQFVATNIYYPFNEYGYDDINPVIDPQDWHIVARLSKDGLWRVSYREDSQKSFSDILADLPARFERLLPGNPKPEDYTIVNFNPYRMHQRCAERFTVGRICLAADAAHLCNPWGGLGLTGGFGDALGLADCLIGIARGQADQGILEKYDQVRRSIYQTVTDPMSTGNFVRVSTSDPHTVLDTDPALQMFLAAKDDPKIKKEIDDSIYAFCHDFTQYYDRREEARL